MLLKKYSFVSITTVLLLAYLPNQASFAFTLTPRQPGDSDGTYRYSERYDNGQGIVRLDAWPLLDGRRYLPDRGVVHEIRPGGTDDLLYLLNEGFGNFYEFIPKGNLEGSFNIENYYSCGSDFACEADGVRIYRSVGAFFKLNYLPTNTDPQGSRLHWIQRVITNFDVDKEGNLINDQIPSDKIDVRPGSISPYYDESFGGTNSTLFRDLSHVQAPYNETNHYFYAETYLVQEVPGVYLDPETRIVKKKVEIYNGVRWGWENEFTPSLSTDSPPTCDNSGGGGSGGGSGGGGCSDNNGWGDERDDRELPLFEEDEFDEDDFYVVTDDTQDIDLEIISNLLCQSQDYAVLPNETNEDWKVFKNAPSTCWFDPETNYGFEFQALDNTLFTELLDFPTGIDTDDRFTVQVGEEILGEFSPGESVDFVSLVGSGVAEFKVLDIDTQKDLADVPFKVGFDRALGSFQMRAISQPEEIPQSIPEPGSVAGILTVGLIGIFGRSRKST